MTKSTKHRAFQLVGTDIHALLARRRQVAIIWNVEDVQSVRPDLSDDHAWEVLQECQRCHDCEFGFTWTHIKCVADEQFPSHDAPVTSTEGDDA